MSTDQWLNQRKTIFKNLIDLKLSTNNFNLSDQSILEKLSDKIGGGAVGEVFAVDDVVVKRISPCLADPKKPLYQYCSDLLEKESYLIPGGNKKFRYILPNLLTEVLIGMILGTRFPDYYAKTLASLITKDDNSINVYIVMERLEPVRAEEYASKDLIMLIYQVSVALLEAQTSYRLTHYDLHIENVLTQNNNSPKTTNIPNTNRRLVYRPKKLAKISDFALARMETQRVIVSPKVDKFPVKSYGEFSPGYDILCLLGSLLVDSKYRKAWEPLYRKDPDVYTFLVKLLAWSLGEKTTNLEELAEKYYTSLKGGRYTFRPKSEQLFVNYYNVKPLSQIVTFLSKLLAGKGWGVIEQTDRPRFYPSYSEIRAFVPNLEFKEVPDSGRSLYRYQTMKLASGISVRAYHIKSNFPASVYNFTLSERQVKECPIQEHYLNTAYITENALKQFKWNLDCCKLDPVNYVVQKNRPGLAINGGFFNINQEFLPIGVYRDEFVYVNKYEVPEDYRDVFGQVVLENNRLRIEKYTGKLDNRLQGFTTGPVLISEGEVVFRPNQLRYLCTDEKNSKGIVISQDEKTITTKGYYKYIVKDDSCDKKFIKDEKTYRRCDKIDPGELSHANNPNPRSALCIFKNGDYLLLTAEGRGNRGVGFDLYTLALTIKQNFPDVESAINLDGGRSSILAWNTVSEKNTVYVSNYDREYVYPVGNILTLFQS